MWLFEILSGFTVGFSSNTSGLAWQLLTMRGHPKLAMSLLLH